MHVGFISNKSYGGHPRLAPMLLWINVPMCVAGGASVSLIPDRAWALSSKVTINETSGTLVPRFSDDIKRLKPQCHGKAITRNQLFSMIEHYGSGSWKRNDIKEQAQWLKDHRDLWEPVKKTGKIALMAMGRHENQYAPEWVEHHLVLGFDKIILFDNNRDGEERLMDVLANYVKKGKVIIEEHPEPYGMLQAYKKTYDERGKDFDWLMALDFDEFLILPRGRRHPCFHEEIRGQGGRGESELDDIR